MSRRPLIALVVAAVVIVGVVALLLPGNDAPTASAPIEGTAKLLNPDAPAEVDDSGVTTPPESQPEFQIQKLAPGEKPPQFVVVSFDGGVESKSGLMQRYLDTAKKVDGRFSFYISGVYLLPDNKMKNNYSPPGKPRGTSDIGFADPGLVGLRIDTLSEAWNAGHEIGTHYLGHFCGAIRLWMTGGPSTRKQSKPVRCRLTPPSSRVAARRAWRGNVRQCTKHSRKPATPMTPLTRGRCAGHNS